MYVGVGPPPPPPTPPARQVGQRQPKPPSRHGDQGGGGGGLGKWASVPPPPPPPQTNFLPALLSISDGQRARCDCQVMWKQTVTVCPTLRLCGQGVRVSYGRWQIVFVSEKSYLMHDVPEPVAKSAPKAAKPRAKPSAKSAAKPATQVVAKSVAQEPIPAAPPIEHVQHCKVKYSRQKR